MDTTVEQLLHQRDADRNAMRIEYEATGADPRVLALLQDLERAEQLIAEQAIQLREIESRLTRKPLTP